MREIAYQRPRSIDEAVTVAAQPGAAERQLFVSSGTVIPATTNRATKPIFI